MKSRHTIYNINIYKTIDNGNYDAKVKQTHETAKFPSQEGKVTKIKQTRCV